MLRVHGHRLARRDAEEGGVEVRDTVHEAAGAGVARPGNIGVRVVQPGQIPAAIAGEFGEHVAALGEHVPKVVGRIHPARIATRHTDDRDRIVFGGTHHRGVFDFLRDAGEFGADVAGQAVGRRIVEDEGG